MPLLEGKASLRISKIYHYPIKALRAAELDSAEVTKHGFRYDRRFLLLNVVKNSDGSVEHKNVHVAHYPESVHFFQEISSQDDGKDILRVTFRPPAAEAKTIDIPLLPDTAHLESVDTIMHKSPTKAFVMPQKYNDWFSACYENEMILTYLGDYRRPVRMSTTSSQPKVGSSNGWLGSLTASATNYFTGNQQKPEDPTITFADCAPYLIVNEKSMDDLHHRLPDGQRMDIIKFRPNIVVSGASEAWDEDYWGELTINDQTVIVCEHNCGRCKSINIDYETGKAGTTATGQMLKLMQRDRRVDPGMKYSPIFGRYAFLHSGSEGNAIRVGDEVVVSRRNGERTIFDWQGLCTKP